jgi:methylated-DNA-[protein]-cysteine S-methyltransferase
MRFCGKKRRMRTSQERHDPATRAVAAHYSATMRTPFAALGIRSDGEAVTGVAYLPGRTREQAPSDRIAARALREIARYLDDPAFRFTVPIRPGGTAFQRLVWDAIGAIPLAESRTYGEVARGLHSAARAVGQACGANRIALIIPCHRVVGSRGSLGGFMRTAGSTQSPSAPSGGRAAAKPQAWGDVDRTAQETEDRDSPLAIKRWLLAHEGYRFGA